MLLGVTTSAKIQIFLLPAPYDIDHGCQGRFILFFSMKPSIPDIGTVIRLEGESAVVRMKGDGSCKKCGVAALGLCRGGLMQVLTVRNSKRARVGDSVKIGLVQRDSVQGICPGLCGPRSCVALRHRGRPCPRNLCRFPATRYYRRLLLADRGLVLLIEAVKAP